MNTQRIHGEEQRMALTPEIHKGIKRVLIKFSGGARPPQEVMVGPGTCATDLLEHLGLGARDYNLSLSTSLDSIFGVDEPVYPMIKDGDLLFVTSRVDAGR
jgi:hypothetical protein